MVVFCLKEGKTLTVPEFCETISQTTNMFKPKTFVSACTQIALGKRKTYGSTKRCGN